MVLTQAHFEISLTLKSFLDVTFLCGFPRCCQAESCQFSWKIKVETGGEAEIGMTNCTISHGKSQEWCLKFLKQTNKQTLLKPAPALSSVLTHRTRPPLPLPQLPTAKEDSADLGVVEGGIAELWIRTPECCCAFASDYWCGFTQWFSIRGAFVLQGIFGRVWKWLGTLLNVPRCTGQPPTTRATQSKMSVLLMWERKRLKRRELHAYSQLIYLADSRNQHNLTKRWYSNTIKSVKKRYHFGHIAAFLQFSISSLRNGNRWFSIVRLLKNPLILV